MEAEPLGEELTDQDRVLIVFGYLGPLALVSLVASRREFVKWHAKQGLVLSATIALVSIVLRLVQLLLDTYFWAFFGLLFRAGVALVLLGALVVMLVGTVRGLAGERFKIPMIGELADRL
jgi:uncharacterized membrane protein